MALWKLHIFVFLLRGLMIFLRILKESFHFAVHALTVNKLRTILSLLGITIGILTIVTVFTVVDSLERNIRDSVSELGSDVVYVQKWPWGGGGEYAWWKYFQRPEPSYKELQMLEKKVNSAQNMAFAFGLSKTVKYRKNSVENTTILPVSHQYYEIWGFDLMEGRYFSELESKSGSPIAVLGYDIAEGLFPSVKEAIGKEIKLLGRKLKVIGVFEKQGQSLVGQDTDETVIIPVNFARTLMSTNDRNGAFIMAMARPGVELDKLKDDLEGAMRSIRRLKPKAENNFALNEISVLSSGLDALFDIVGIAGMVIGGFSILVGGFGIANIMFVSVKERTGQIGIQKSLGAKNHFILLQFLSESVLLCLTGGAVGLLLVWLAVSLGGSQIDFDISLSLKNVLEGVFISIGIGLVSGFVPAYSAARLNPVDAIRKGS